MTTESSRRARRSRPRDPCLRSSKAEQPVLTRKCVGSSPTGGTMRTRPLGAALRSRRSRGRFEPCRPLHLCPRSTKVVSQPRKPRASVRFRPRARPRFDRIANARAVQRMNAGVTCRRSLVRSQPRAPMSCSSSRPGNRALNPVTWVRLPYTTPASKTPSSNGPRI
jgi:hypothetical protein